LEEKRNPQQTIEEFEDELEEELKELENMSLENLETITRL
jgi:hypothetical protein